MPPPYRTFALFFAAGCTPVTPAGEGPAPQPSPRRSASTAPSAEPPSARHVEALAGGGAHTCLLRDGAVTYWGKDTEGQIGDGARAAARAPTRVEGLVDPVRVALGFQHSCALERSGRVQCWGSNVLKELPS